MFISDKLLASPENERVNETLGQDARTLLSQVRRTREREKKEEKQAKEDKKRKDREQKKFEVSNIIITLILKSVLV